jgi:lactate dehydrogenase-like 2-hydroxyacid dehydrogenase
MQILTAACRVTCWPGDLPPAPSDLRDALVDCDGVLCLLTDRIDADLLDACPRLRVISTMAVGIDNIDLAAATARGVLVGNTPDVLTDTCADWTFALLLALARRLPEAQALVQQGQWHTWGPLVLLGHDVHHATLGLVGLGSIGRAVAERARGFAMRVLYTAPHRHPQEEDALGLEYVSLPDLLAGADFVSLHAPLTEATRGMIDGAALRRMQPQAYLINTARGPLVDTEALVEALRAGTIAGAALDVTDPEPLPADHPLAHLPNVIVVPHIASASVATRGIMARLAAQNLLAGLVGDPMPFLVNPAALGQGRQNLPRAWQLG